MTSPVEMKWTPGPWFAEGLIVITFGGANQLARFLFGKFKGPEEAAANARVSAAAPELYEALRAAKVALWMASEMSIGEFEHTALGGKITAALAKAVTP